MRVGRGRLSRWCGSRSWLTPRGRRCAWAHELELAIEALVIDEAERLAAAPVVADAVEASLASFCAAGPAPLARSLVPRESDPSRSLRRPILLRALRRVDEDVTETVDYVPGRFNVVRNVRL
jgi:transposase